MTAAGKFVRTTAFKLSAIYLAVLSASALFFVIYISHATDALLNQQIKDTIATELVGLSDQYHIGGLSAVAVAMEQRAGQPSAPLYLLTDGAGHPLAGNVAEVSGDVLDRARIDPVTVTYRRSPTDRAERTAMVQVVPLASGYRIMVGRDLDEREQFRAIVTRALVWALAVMVGLAAVTYVFVNRRVLRRIDSLSATSVRIMQGDLSGRLEVTESGDEFDRLAESLNAMLDRIELLLYGLKDVSDNIAHDLKTPLTRLRNRVEAALAGPADGAAYHAALEATIEESDRLIQTFNALLMIARIEAGSSDGAISEGVDASVVVHDVAELYEPVAEEEGIALTIDAPQPVMVTVNRELLSQALANLVDNAIKYAGETGDGTTRRIVISAFQEMDKLVLRVRDNGPGIPPEERQHVLRRFVRLEKSRSLPGSGLGLSLVAAVVRLHHGEIELGDGNPGLVVTLRLPLK